MQKLRALNCGLSGLMGNRTSFLPDLSIPAAHLGAFHHYSTTQLVHSNWDYKNLPYHNKKWRVMNVKKKLHRMGRLKPTDPFYEDIMPGKPK